MKKDKNTSSQNFFDTKKFTKLFFISIIFTIASTIVLAGLFLKGNNLENLLYYARVPMSDGSTQAVKNCIEFCVPTAISIFILTNIFSFIILLNKGSILRHSEKNKFRFPASSLRFIYRHGFLISFLLVICAILFFGIEIDAFSYINGMVRTTQVYEEEYTPPQDQTYQFPKRKKNLIFIFLESMETSFASVEEGGFMEKIIFLI